MKLTLLKSALLVSSLSLSMAAMAHDGQEGKPPMPGHEQMMKKHKALPADAVVVPGFGVIPGKLLKLTDAQKTDLKAIHDDIAAKVKEIKGANPDKADKPAFNSEADKVRKEQLASGKLDPNAVIDAMEKDHKAMKDFKDQADKDHAKKHEAFESMHKEIDQKWIKFYDGLTDAQKAKVVEFFKKAPKHHKGLPPKGGHQPQPQPVKAAE